MVVNNNICVSTYMHFYIYTYIYKPGFISVLVQAAITKVP